MTLQEHPRKSKATNSQLSTLNSQLSFYAQWRARCGVAAVFREDHETPPPEHLLQAIWQHQRLLRDQLTTLDGKNVRVLHPGFANHEAGPDFRGAMVQIGDEPPRAGDVEVDLQSSGWRAHHHAGNPAFEKVVLHVIWDSARPAAGEIPTLPLRRLLDAPISELSTWLGREGGVPLPENLLGQCSAPLRVLSEPKLTELLHQAAQVRWQSKAAQFQARARQAGWEQSFWEGLFRALGYKHNVWPMQRLAELRPRWGSPKLSPLALQARLFGLSGLLPVDLSRAQTASDSYLRRIWDHWWRERDECSDCILPRGLWRFHGLRPANHPQRRLALAAHWLTEENFLAKLEKWFTTELPSEPTRLADSLLKILQVERDDFWSWHWTFRSARLKKPQPLLGAARVTDLAVNVILPWFWVRAAEGKNEKLQRVAEHRYLAWPSAEDNAVLRLARQRLLGGAPARALLGAAAQQGLLQIVRDFCDHSNAICENCQFPQLVREWHSVE
ncbi:MAG: DUF2851 family protein [Verrucomicrobia bacterium]|nr:DUF2851 family protein [Verrucomicrobiota bacterium]